MRIFHLLRACALLCLMALPVAAQTYQPTPGGAPAPMTGIYCLNAAGTALVTCNGDGAVGMDTNGAAFRGEVAMTVDSTYAAGRSLKANCSAAGVVSVTYPDNSTGLWSVAVGIQTLPIAVTKVSSVGTTAACTYANLK